MRFDDLFRDLESQLDVELAAAERAAAEEQERYRIGRLALRDRLLAMPPTLDLTLRQQRLQVVREGVGRDWLTGRIEEGSASGSYCFVPFASIRSINLQRPSVNVSIASSDRPAGVADRLTFPFVLRDLCRRRVWAEVHATGVLQGTIDRVGRDHLDLALHEADSSRREANVHGYAIVPFDAIDWVRLEG